MKILIVEDDELTAKALITVLSNQNYAVEVATDGQAGWELVQAFAYDLVMLDVILPKLDGISLCQRLRHSGYQMPILLLTGRDSSHEKVIGLDAGADDYVVKPFSPKELEARIRSVLRRVEKTGTSGIPSSGVIQINNIRIDTNKRQVYKGDERIRLTGMEFSLLELLVGRSGEPFSRAEILQEVWGYTPERHVDTRVVDVHISRLRAKLEDDPSNPELILTARGTGYLFQRIVPPGETE